MQDPNDKCSLLEANIPHGSYCYTIENITPDAEYGFIMRTKVCPFWRKFRDEYPDPGYCTYLKLGDFMENGTMLLWDQVKECGINED